jgi:hypothetical protein
MALLARAHLLMRPSVSQIRLAVYSTNIEGTKKVNIIYHVSETNLLPLHQILTVYVQRHTDADTLCDRTTMNWKFSHTS